jgi:phosphohistidine phosphatase SixA
MKSKKERDARPLAPEGIEDARRAGEFLKKMGIKPDLVVTTKKRRTIDTADLVMKVLDADAPIARVGGGFKVNASLSEISGCIRAWIAGAKPVPRVVLFVGHEIQQKALAKANRLEVPGDRYGVVLVHEIDAYGNWKQPQCFVGE